ncbi:hypothetical protein D3C87_1971070 [compost metagenome]
MYRFRSMFSKRMNHIPSAENTANNWHDFAEKHRAKSVPEGFLFPENSFQMLQSSCVPLGLQIPPPHRYCILLKNRTDYRQTDHWPLV